MQRYSFSTQQPDRDRDGEYVRFQDVRDLIRGIMLHASPCTTACHSTIPDRVLDSACEAVGANRADFD